MTGAKTRKVLTCRAAGCGRWESYPPRQFCCGSCGAKYDFSIDVSHWNGNQCVRHGAEAAPVQQSSTTEPPTSKGGGKGKGAGKGWSGKGGAKVTDGPIAKGFKWLYEKEVENFQLTEFDLPLFRHFEELSRDRMEEMAGLPRFAVYKPLFMLLAQRKFAPPDEDEDSLVWLLDKARRKVNTAEKAVDTAKEQKAAAQGVLDRANLGLKEQEKELAEAKAERDALDLKKSALLLERTGAAIGQPKPSAPVVTVTVAKPAVVLEQRVNGFTKILDKATTDRKQYVSRLTTVESTLKDLKASIPADTDGEEAAGRDDGARGRSTSPRNQTTKLTTERLAKAEKEKDELVGQIARCDEVKNDVEPLLATLRAQAEAYNSADAMIAGTAEKYSDFSDDL